MHASNLTRALLCTALGVALAGCSQSGPPATSGAASADVAALDSGSSLEAPADLLALEPGTLGTRRGDFGRLDAGARPLQRALDAIAPQLGLNATDLELKSVEEDELGQTHFRLQQFKEGLEVVGGDLLIHADDEGRIFALGGGAHDGYEIPATPSVNRALAVARAELTPDIPHRAPESTRLVYVFDGNEELHLAWEVTFHDDLPERVFVDAHSGEVADRHPLACGAMDRVINDLSLAPDDGGKVVRREGERPTGEVHADAAYETSGYSAKAFSELFGRDSYDGKGGKLVNVVNTGITNNGFWLDDQKLILWGEGDGKRWARVMAADPDFAAHELAHGISKSTAGFVSRGESGALNESFSDIFAAAADAQTRGRVDAGTWKWAEQAFTPGTRGDACRYLDDPAKDRISRDHYADRFTGSEDNGGVHYNSGITNLAFALLVKGGTHPRSKSRLEVPALGMTKSAKVFYRALTRYLRSNSTFADAREATTLAAKDLYGEAAEHSVAMAWAAVGVGAAPSQPAPSTSTPAPAPSQPAPSTSTPAPAPSQPAPSTSTPAPGPTKPAGGAKPLPFPSGFPSRLPTRPTPSGSTGSSTNESTETSTETSTQTQSNTPGSPSVPSNAGGAKPSTGSAGGAKPSSNAGGAKPSTSTPSNTGSSTNESSQTSTETSTQTQTSTSTPGNAGGAKPTTSAPRPKPSFPRTKPSTRPSFPGTKTRTKPSLPAGFGGFSAGVAGGAPFDLARILQSLAQRPAASSSSSRSEIQTESRNGFVTVTHKGKVVFRGPGREVETQQVQENSRDVTIVLVDGREVYRDSQ